MTQGTAEGQSQSGRLRPARWLMPSLILLGLLSAALLWFSTPYGLGLVNDTASYVGGAENILKGNGYSRISGGGEIIPITHFPPLFSLLLAGLSLAGMSLITAGKLAVVGLFGLNVTLTGWLTYRLSCSSSFALLAAFLLGVSDLLLEVHAYLLSEPLFLTLLLLGALCFSWFYENRRPAVLALAGFIFGAAFLTRYAGISLAAAAVAAAFLLEWKKPSPERKINLSWPPLAGMLTAAAVPALIWALYTFSAAGGLGNRVVLWHPISAAQLLEMLKNLLSWLAPDDFLRALPLAGRALSLLSLLVVPALLAAAAIILRRLYRRNKPVPVSAGAAGALLMVLQVLFYLAFLVISLSLFDASTPLDARILSPAYLCLLVLFASALAWLWQRSCGRTPAKAALVIGIALLMLFSSRDGLDESRYLRQDGLGFANHGWTQSPAVAAIQALPEVTLYSDKPAALYLLAGRSAYTVLSPVDPVTLQPRPGYQDDIKRMRTAIKDGSAILILFTTPSTANPDEAQSIAALTSGLPVYADYGIIFIAGLRR